MSESNTFEEKRAYPRVSVQITVQYHFVQGSFSSNDVPEGRKKLEATTLNMSLGGLFLETGTKKLGVGSILNLTLFLPDNSRPLTALAETVRAEGTGVGLRFLAIQKEDGKALESYLESFLGGRQKNGLPPKTKSPFQDQLQITARRVSQNSVTVLELEGILDFNSAEAFETRLQELFQRKEYRIVLNLSKVTYISSAGIGILMGVIKDVRTNKGDIKIADVHPEVDRVFQLLEITGFFQFFKTEQDAVSAF